MPKQNSDLGCAKFISFKHTTHKSAFTILPRGVVWSSFFFIPSPNSGNSPAQTVLTKRKTQTYTTSKRCAFDKVFSHFIPSGEGHEKSKKTWQGWGKSRNSYGSLVHMRIRTVDASEIKVNSPVEVGSLSHYLQGFTHCLGFCPSTVGWAKWQKVLKIGVAPYKSSATRALGRRISTKLRCFPLSRFGFSYLSAVWQVVTINAVYVFLTHIGWQITNNGQSIKSCNASIHSMVNLHLISPAIKEIEIESRNTSHTFHSNKSVRYLTLRKLHEKIWNIF